MNKLNEMDYYYIHNYQGHLFSPYTFTAIWGKNQGMGREKSFSFDSEDEMHEKIHELFKNKLKHGYKLLYSYPQHSEYEEMVTDINNRLVS
ncbi:MAG: WGR domain-containing protein [Spirochaetales bacterium]|nr:WGR domain-containing protein [Spirochaetales bacterium]